MRQALFRFIAVIALTLGVTAGALAQGAAHPGLKPYTPKRIEWITTVLQAALRKDLTADSKFLLQVVARDSETILLYVRYLPDVKKGTMNLQVNAAREVIALTSKAYGWDKWLKVQEDIQPGSQAGK